MNVFHVEFAKTGHNVSGGEVFMLQLMQVMREREYSNTLLTTDNAKSTYAQKANTADVTFKTINSSRSEKIHIFFSYLYRLPLIVRLIHSIDTGEGQSPDMIVCHSLFFPNSIATYLLARKFPKARLLFWHHLLPPKLIYGYRGEFKRQRHIPTLSLLHLILNQTLYTHIIKKLNRGTIVTVNEYYQERLRAIHNKLVVRVVYPFTQLPDQLTSTPQPAYDIVWVGRFQGLKGLVDIPSIIHEINKKGLKVKIAILGDGDERVRRELLARATTMGVSDQISLLGFITGKAKEKLLGSSRVFLSTSYYESFGLAITEALGLSLPVVAYDLPTFRVFKNALVVAPIGNQAKVADAIYQLLTDSEYYKAQQIASRATLKSIAPGNTNQRLMELLQS